MNIVFWFLVVLLLFLVWFVLRHLFVGVGKFMYGRYDDLADIISGNADEEQILEDDEISEENKEEFKKYYEENMKG